MEEELTAQLSPMAQLVAYLAITAASAAFTAFKGTEFYRQRRSVKERIVLWAIDKAVDWGYETFTRPYKAKTDSQKLTDPQRREIMSRVKTKARAEARRKGADKHPILQDDALLKSYIERALKARKGQPTS